MGVSINCILYPLKTILRIKELEVTLCHAWEKCGRRAAVEGGLLLSGGLGAGLTLAPASPYPFAATLLT